MPGLHCQLHLPCVCVCVEGKGQDGYMHGTCMCIASVPARVCTVSCIAGVNVPPVLLISGQSGSGSGRLLPSACDPSALRPPPVLGLC